MRGKRAKAYRKLMAVYAMNFGFREPYQVLVDPMIIQDALKFKMDLVPALERTLQGQVKAMITQCCIRALYDATPPVPAAITLAKTLERRRCNHSISEPALSPLNCLLSVILPDTAAPAPNIHRYVLATNDPRTREVFRGYAGVPGVHITRSVMVMDVVSGATVKYREGEEEGKMRRGIKRGGGSGGKRKRDGEGGDDEGGGGKEVKGREEGGGGQVEKVKGKKYGPKQPNPKSTMKKKRKLADPQPRKPKVKDDGIEGEGDVEKKRRRKGKENTETGGGDAGTIVTAVTDTNGGSGGG